VALGTRLISTPRPAFLDLFLSPSLPCFALPTNFVFSASAYPVPAIYSAQKKKMAEGKEEARPSAVQMLQEVTGDIWKVPCDWVCVTTNGECNSKGDAVMGKGLALQARKRVLGCEKVLGKLLQLKGNHVHPIGRWMDLEASTTKRLISVPTKVRWRDKSDVKLIDASCRELLALWTSESTVTRPIMVALPKLGCLNGELDYERQVKPILLRYFADNLCFFVCV